ncbi:hypothetical protein GE061_015543 [Apolygus lucorum]|uniref:Uncharacterized protein n=1 Tax=Apolygus lucorum TaxID=248454 RepID=A0A6A4JHC2_APOLU|nr:hypothetical protein GE061_015543 [Apolygus lucorum]
MKVRCEDTKERIKTNYAGSKSQVYPSSSDDELPGGLCPCIPSPCFIYKGILSKWKKHDLSSESESLVLCRFNDQSNSSCMTTLAFLISEVREIEDLLSSIERDTNIRHDRSRGKLLQLKQEIMDTLLVRSPEKTEVIQEFMDKIKAYKKKLILVNLENALNRNDSIYAESLASNTLLDKLLTRNVTARPDMATQVSTKCENSDSVKHSKKQNVNWPWKCWTRNTFSKERGHVKSEKRHKRFSNTISGSKKCQAERKELGAVHSWPVLKPQGKEPLPELSTPVVVKPKIQKECKTERKKTHEKENQTSKGSVNQGISVQSIFLKEIPSSSLFKDKGTGSNVMLRPGVSRSVSAQSGSLVLRCEGVTQTISDGFEEVSRNYSTGSIDSERKGSEGPDTSSELLSVKQLTEEEDFLTTSCSHPSIAVLGMTSESGTMDEYDVSSCAEENPPLKTRETGLWYLSAKQLCDEMFEQAYIACQ